MEVLPYGTDEPVLYDVLEGPNPNGGQQQTCASKSSGEGIGGRMNDCSQPIYDILEELVSNEQEVVNGTNSPQKGNVRVMMADMSKKVYDKEERSEPRNNDGGDYQQYLRSTITSTTRRRSLYLNRIEWQCKDIKTHFIYTYTTGSYRPMY